MSVGVSLVMIAVGAILSFAINVPPNPHFNWVTAGVVLMATGVLGLLISLGQTGAFGGPRQEERRFTRRQVVYSDRARPDGYRGGYGGAYRRDDLT